MPNDQAAMIAEAKKILAEKGISSNVIGDSSRNGRLVFLSRLRRDFGAEAVEMVKGHAFGMSRQADEEDRVIANSAVNAALDEVIKIIRGYAVINSPEMLVSRIAALKSTPSPEAQ